MDGTVHQAAGRRSRQTLPPDQIDIERAILASILDGARLNGPAPSSLDAAHEAAVYHLSTGGERTRGRLALLAGAALGLDRGTVLALAAAAELLHNASLIHDDVQDRSSQRRGRPSVWVLYGTGVALCAGDLLISCAYRALCRDVPPMLLPTLIDLCHLAVAEAIRGQCGDLTEGQSHCSIAVYREIAGAKSGALLALPLQLAIAAAELPARQVALAHEIGLLLATAYQIVDDLEDCASDSGEDGSAGSLNVVRVFQAGGHGVAAGQMARKLARECLEQAAQLTLQMPAALQVSVSSISGRLAGKL
ncbi:MAG: hypothetical protein RL026_1293 [Pseudomonadota bacterium]|jgi:geranylgeranyl pyrophosphate synthase